MWRFILLALCAVCSFGNAASMHEARAGIAAEAMGEVGSTEWEATWSPILPFTTLPTETWCNFFVAQMVTRAGMPPPLILIDGHWRYPLAGEWGNPNVKIPNWEVIYPNAGQRSLTPRQIFDLRAKGDIVASKKHVAIVLGSKTTISANSLNAYTQQPLLDDAGNDYRKAGVAPYGSVVTSPFGFRDGNETYVVRRYVGNSNESPEDIVARRAFRGVVRHSVNFVNRFVRRVSTPFDPALGPLLSERGFDAPARIKEAIHRGQSVGAVVWSSREERGREVLLGVGEDAESIVRSYIANVMNVRSPIPLETMWGFQPFLNGLGWWATIDGNKIVRQELQISDLVRRAVQRTRDDANTVRERDRRARESSAEWKADVQKQLDSEARYRRIKASEAFLRSVSGGSNVSIEVGTGRAGSGGGQNGGGYGAPHASGQSGGRGGYGTADCPAVACIDVGPPTYR